MVCEFKAYSSTRLESPGGLLLVGGGILEQSLRGHVWRSLCSVPLGIAAFGGPSAGARILA